ncbi:unnamed protein product [Plutella xylostella]|uniref:(diamondback moth) hypothetical protein n=1 Tax=Plutella xylostella TaxID=51655 RepID=A0A8S4FBV7_PLUXY|nr:unnamed protein product [Plutella xylostella]
MTNASLSEEFVINTLTRTHAQWPKRLHRPLELDDGDGDGRLTAASARAAARAAALSGPRGVCGVRAAGREPGNGNQPS